MTAVPRKVKFKDVTISDGESLSASVNLDGLFPVGVVVPSGWNAASLTFQASVDNSTFYDLYSEISGTHSEVTVSAAASKAIAFDANNFTPATHLKLRSGTTGSAVNQTGDVTLTLVLANFTTS